MKLVVLDSLNNRELLLAAHQQQRLESHACPPDNNLLLFRLMLPHPINFFHHPQNVFDRWQQIGVKLETPSKEPFVQLLSEVAPGQHQPIEPS